MIYCTIQKPVEALAVDVSVTMVRFLFLSCQDQRNQDTAENHYP
jgi:hypothetical protein